MHEHEWVDVGGRKGCSSCDFFLLENEVVVTMEFLEDFAGQPANFKWEEWKQHGGVK